MMTPAVRSRSLHRRALLIAIFFLVAGCDVFGGLIAPTEAQTATTGTDSAPSTVVSPPTPSTTTLVPTSPPPQQPTPSRNETGEPNATATSFPTTDVPVATEATNETKDNLLNNSSALPSQQHQELPSSSVAQIAVTTVAVGIAFIGNGGIGPMGEIQSVTVIGMVGSQCSATEDMKSTPLAVTPWKLVDDNETGYLLGNCVLVATGLFAMSLLVAVLDVKFKYDQMSNAEQASEEFPDLAEEGHEREPRTKALTALSMPGKGYLFLALCHQGICLESHHRVHDSSRSGTGLILMGLGLVYSVVICIVLGFFMKRRFQGKCYRYKYAQHQVPYLLSLGMPKAFWMPLKFTKRYGAIFEDYYNTDVWFAVYNPLVKGNLLALIAAVEMNCAAQYSLLALVHLGEAIYRIVRRPNTILIANVSGIIACLFTALVACTAAFDSPIMSMEIALLVQSLLSVVCHLLVAILMGMDRLVWQKRELKYRHEHDDFDYVEYGLDDEPFTEETDSDSDSHLSVSDTERYDRRRMRSMRRRSGSGGNMTSADDEDLFGPSDGEERGDGRRGGGGGRSSSRTGSSKDGFLVQLKKIHQGGGDGKEGEPFSAEFLKAIKRPGRRVTSKNKRTAHKKLPSEEKDALGNPLLTVPGDGSESSSGRRGSQTSDGSATSNSSSRNSDPSTTKKTNTKKSTNTITRRPIMEF